jgi:ubiquinone/menaquinone biosynthesis C-methylase UbiE
MDGMQTREQVRNFYDSVGWQQIGDCCYQNSRYEDLRPVSQDYIHACHMRILRHLAPTGRYMLDAGSGPIQYPEYLKYSRQYAYRVCVDVSMIALKEASSRLGEHGLCVLADVSRLPFPEGVFEGIVSLHTIQHLEEPGQKRAYDELVRVAVPGSAAVIVNRWRSSIFMNIAAPFLSLTKRLIYNYRRFSGRETYPRHPASVGQAGAPAKGTYTFRYNYPWLKEVVAARYPTEVFVWRSVSTNFLRMMVHQKLGGRRLLRWLYQLEERFPHFFGRFGQYPLVVIRKAGAAEGQTDA